MLKIIVQPTLSLLHNTSFTQLSAARLALIHIYRKVSVNQSLIQLENKSGQEVTHPEFCILQTIPKYQSRTSQFNIFHFTKNELGLNEFIS